MDPAARDDRRAAPYGGEQGVPTAEPLLRADHLPRGLGQEVV